MGIIFQSYYIRAMYLIRQQQEPVDYIIGPGIPHSVTELVEVRFNYLGLNYKDYVVVDPQFYRPAEENRLLADSTKAREKLGWKPAVAFETLLRMMIDEDLKWLSQNC
jgi:GDPmannose 4,6-dehydratase